MKTIFRFFSLAMLFTAFSAVGVFAQNPCDDVTGQTELDKKFRDNYAGNRAAQKVAIDAGKQFLEKYGACESTKDFTDYLKNYLPPMEKKIKDAEAAESAAAAKGALYQRFDKAFQAKNWDEVYAAGQEVIAKEPDNLDVMLVLGSIGFDETAKNKNNKYNEQTLRYARMAIDKMNAGVTSPKFGLFQYTYNNKADAIGWMNMSLGYINYYAQNNKKDSLRYFYQAAQNGETKTNSVVYESIGRYYLDETSRLAEEVRTMAASVKDTDPEDVKNTKAAEIKAKVALLNGNAERAIDAYARAYRTAKTDAANKAYRDGLYAKIQSLYNVRFGKADGIDAYISSTVAKPMPDPTSAVTPVADPETTTTTTTGSVDTSVTPAPAAATKPAATAVKNTATTAPAKAAVTTKPAAKKTVAKKTVAKKTN